MLDLRRLFQKGEDDPLAALSPSLQPDGGLEAEFQALVADQLARGGVPGHLVDIDVRATGSHKEGRPVFCAMVRIKAWDERAVLRLLLGLPLLQDRIKRALRTGWLHEVASFGGIWLHASAQLHEREVLKSLRDVLLDVEARSAVPAVDSLWSLRDSEG